MERYSADPAGGLPHEDAATKRNDARDSLLLTAKLRHAGMTEPEAVRVRNLSAGGLMAEYGDAVATGTSIEVEVRNIGWVKGRVAWVVDGRIGIAFDSEIDPKAARKPVGGGAHTPVYAKAPVRRY